MDPAGSMLESSLSAGPVQEVPPSCSHTYTCLYSRDSLLNYPYTQAGPQALLGSLYPAHIPMVQISIIIVGEILIYFSGVALLHIVFLQEETLAQGS